MEFQRDSQSPPQRPAHLLRQPAVPNQKAEQRPDANPLLDAPLPVRPEAAIRQKISKKHNDLAQPSPAAERNIILHHTGLQNLPLVFQFGLYLSDTAFNTFNRLVPAHYGWINNMVGIVIDLDRYTLHEVGNFPAQIAEPLRKILVEAAQQYEPTDKLHSTTRKRDQHRLAVRAAHQLLEQEARGELRHYPVSTFDLATMREANSRGRFKSHVFAYMDALEANNMQPLTTPPEKPGLISRFGDFASFQLDRWRKRAEAREHLQKFLQNLPSNNADS